jgi:hypothetical protein
MVVDGRHTGDRSDAIYELLDLGLEHRTAQRHPTRYCGHVDRPRVRDEASDSRAHARRQHFVARRWLFDNRRQCAGGNSAKTVFGVARDRSGRASNRMRGVQNGVTQPRTSAPALLRVGEIHQPRSNSNAG